MYDGIRYLVPVRCLSGFRRCWRLLLQSVWYVRGLMLILREDSDLRGPL